MRQELRRLSRHTNRRRPGRSSRHVCVPTAEWLEDRALLATFTVVNNSNSGPGSFRQAILDANTSPGADRIEFKITTPSKSIAVLSTGLPTISGPVAIDATTQVGYAGKPLVEITGQDALDEYGLVIETSGVTVKGLAINRFLRDGLIIRGSNAYGNAVQACYVGLGLDGSTNAGNRFSGIAIGGGAHHNTIGGATPAERNVLSGAKWYFGVALFDPGTERNVVIGNFVGTDASGTAAVPNFDGGVLLRSGASRNTIGGVNTSGQLTGGNLISGNTQEGITFQDPTTTENQVLGNRIGTSYDGKFDLGNGYAGILLWGGASGNSIGAGTASTLNVISGNDHEGIAIIQQGTSSNVIAGNYIGTNAAGDARLANSWDGILIGSGASGNTIGGAESGARNVISGNLNSGITIRDVGTSSNSVLGNYVGLGADGATVVGNAYHGIYVSNGATGNHVGGTTTGKRNVLSGNGYYGFYADGTTTSGNFAEGNYIGTDSTGLIAKGNASSGAGGGVALYQAGANTIGGTTSGAGNVIAGNSNTGWALILLHSSNNLVAGNLMGVGADGSTALGNAGGVLVTGTSSRNTIGGATDIARNIISGNASRGIILGGNGGGTTGNLVVGNYIGLLADGTTVRGNGQQGIQLAGGAKDNTIGGALSGEGNVICGNSTGIQLRDDTTTGNRIIGNYIGTTPAGGPGGGNIGDGIRIELGASMNQIGGFQILQNAGQDLGNTIAYNKGSGIIVGSNVSDPATRNTISRNSIYSNGGLAIDLGADGITPNDVLDNDEGPNRLQNHPVIWSASYVDGVTLLRGSLLSHPDMAFRVEFFASIASSNPGSVNTQEFLGSMTVRTESSGYTTFEYRPTALVPDGRLVTATATDADGNTSELGPAVTTFSATEEPPSIGGYVSRGATSKEVPVRLDRVGMDRDGRDAIHTSPAGSQAVTTWIVIHGRDNNAQDMADLANAIDGFKDGDQVLTLDWEAGAGDNGTIETLDFLAGAQWISSVGAWAAQALNDMGIANNNVNLVGHSWGSLLAYEIAKDLVLAGGGPVRSIIALDPATGSFGIEGDFYTWSDVRFDAVSSSSWAFEGSLWGSNARAATARETIAMQVPSVLPHPGDLLGKDAETEIHGNIYRLFTNLVYENYPPQSGALSWMHPNRLSQMFSLERLLSGESGRWMLNSYPSLAGYEGMLTGRYDAAMGKWYPDSLQYYDHETGIPMRQGTESDPAPDRYGDDLSAASPYVLKDGATTFSNWIGDINRTDMIRISVTQRRVFRMQALDNPNLVAILCDESGNPINTGWGFSGLTYAVATSRKTLQQTLEAGKIYYLRILRIYDAPYYLNGLWIFNGVDITGYQYVPDNPYKLIIFISAR